MTRTSHGLRGRRNLRGLRGLASALALGIVLGACSAGGGTAGSGSASPVSGGTLTWGIASEPSCFDPHFHSLVSDSAVIRNLVDSLVYQNKDGSFSPWLADSWSVTDKGTDYTFHLAKGVKFSDGKTLDAAAVKANLDYVRDTSHGSTYASLLASVKNITADGLTVRIALKQPDSSLLSSLSSVSLGIISPGKLDKGDALCTPGSGLAGSGPFTIASYTRGEEVRLVRNKNYTSPPKTQDHNGAAYLDSIVYKFMPEDSVRIGALESGEVDAISGVPALDVKTLQADPAITYTDGPRSSSTFGFVINGAQAPWNNVSLRKAFRDGFDLNAIVKSVYAGQVDRAWSWVGADSPEFAPSLKNSWGDDPAEANKLLDAAGWTGRDSQGYRTKNGKRLTIQVTYDSDSVRDQRDTLIEAVQDQLKKNTGIQLELTTPPWSTVAASISKGTWSVYPATFGKVDYANSVTGTWGAYFYAATKWKPTKAIHLATAALAATDRKTVLTDLDAVQKYLVQDEALFVPLTESTFQIAYRSNVHGLGFDYSSATPDGGYTAWVG